MPDLFGREPGLVIRGERRRFGRWLPDFCGVCGDPLMQFEIAVVIAANGARQYRPRCLTCDQLHNASVPHDRLTDSERASATILRDNRDGTPCERCGRLEGVELHHWAPQSRFADSDHWPTAMLCVKCHTLWHQIMKCED